MAQNTKTDFKCDQCNDKFSTNANLKKHKQTHVTGEYKCKVENCVRVKPFENPQALDSHLRKKHNLKKEQIESLHPEIYPTKIEQQNNINGDHNNVNIYNNTININVQLQTMFPFPYYSPYLSEEIQDKIEKYLSTVNEGTPKCDVVPHVFEIIYFSPDCPYNHSIGIKSRRMEKVFAYEKNAYKEMLYKDMHEQLSKHLLTVLEMVENKLTMNDINELSKKIYKKKMLDICVKNNDIFNKTKEMIEKQKYDRDNHNKFLDELCLENKKIAEEKQRIIDQKLKNKKA